MKYLEKEPSSTVGKKKKKRKRNKNYIKREEEKKRTPRGRDEHISHSSTEDSTKAIGTPKKPQKIVKLKDSELNIFVGLGLSEPEIMEIYNKTGCDLDATLQTIIDSY
mmetsp:Transcript_18598/g.16477  ORF Transcript_18598/g.16477 Transcript_18598/m.16477 type:complete len:108 (-) Transcript_18598:60-383(-)|eukprot:CAMPEP_0205813600 /NCGR_PEP_ID=MMETSP0205-20121125/18305_1 /ASSEMBLY_ACC=CAM_ASM_000278 /TAXON_ID=36767 /ORGANISM="Euplotes focardii, Strain TN1" /LENGTH=107 /DNA_ID=CAMNT_0053095943 /DNA_START=115 /DNA_END=441 /DNA_ORIENTATION=-